MSHPKRPYATTAVVLWGISAMLILPSLAQVLYGVPISEGLAPVGFSIGPLLGIGGTLLFLSKKPQRSERWSDDGYAADQMNDVLDASDPRE